MRQILAAAILLSLHGCGNLALADPAPIRRIVVIPPGGSIVVRPMGSDATATLPYCDSRYAAAGDPCVVRR